MRTRIGNLGTRLLRLRRNSSGNAKVPSFFLRFPSKEPSFFQISDDPIGADTAIASAALEFEPRAVDEGWLSVWAVFMATEEDCVKAGFAALRSNRQTLHTLKLSSSVFQEAQVKFEQQATDTFSCIAHLHCGLFLEKQEQREALVRVILQQLENGKIDKEQIYTRITKGEIKGLLQKVYKICKDSGIPVELEKASPWAQEIIAADNQLTQE
jgi:hypothetical protein